MAMQLHPKMIAVSGWWEITFYAEEVDLETGAYDYYYIPVQICGEYENAMCESGLCRRKVVKWRDIVRVLESWISDVDGASEKLT